LKRSAIIVLPPLGLSACFVLVLWICTRFSYFEAPEWSLTRSKSRSSSTPSFWLMCLIFHGGILLFQKLDERGEGIHVRMNGDSFSTVIIIQNVAHAVTFGYQIQEGVRVREMSSVVKRSSLSQKLESSQVLELVKFSKCCLSRLCCSQWLHLFHCQERWHCQLNSIHVPRPDRPLLLAAMS